jgi:hypothetical protein
MEVANIASALAGASATQAINIGVLSAVQALAATQAAAMLASLGLGTTIDAFA